MGTKVPNLQESLLFYVQMKSSLSCITMSSKNFTEQKSRAYLMRVYDLW